MKPFPTCEYARNDDNTRVRSNTSRYLAAMPVAIRTDLHSASCVWCAKCSNAKWEQSLQGIMNKMWNLNSIFVTILLHACVLIQFLSQTFADKNWAKRTNNTFAAAGTFSIFSSYFLCDCLIFLLEKAFCITWNVNLSSAYLFAFRKKGFYSFDSSGFAS